MEDNQKYSFEDIFEHDELGLFEEEEEQAALELESILTFISK